MPLPMPQGAPPGGGLNLPKSPVGGSSGPGASPMVQPGDGAGMEAHAEEEVRKMMHNLLLVMGKLKPGTIKFNALAGALNKLNGVFGKPTAENAPAGGPRPPMPMGNAVPPGIGGQPPGLPMRGGGALAGGMGGISAGRM